MTAVTPGAPTARGCRPVLRRRGSTSASGPDRLLGHLDVLGQALDDPWGVAINQSNLVVALLYTEGPQRAYEELRAVARDAVALGDIELSIDVLETSAAIWAGLGRPERAATSLGAAEQQRTVSGIPRADPNQQYLDRFIEPARESLAEPVWTTAYQRGTSLSLEDAVAETLSEVLAS